MTVVDRGEHFLGRGEFCDPWEDGFEAVEVGAFVGIGDGVGHDCQFVASLVRRPGSGLDADAGRDAGEDDPGDLAPAELEVELGAVERVPAVLGDQRCRGRSGPPRCGARRSPGPAWHRSGFPRCVS